MSITKTKATTTIAIQKRADAGLLLVGLDLGTNTTCIQVANPVTGQVEVCELVPSIVGYTTEGILPGIIPGDATALFGQLALKYKLHLNLVQPLRDGVVADMDAARDFLEHIKSVAGLSPEVEVRAVIGMPENSESRLIARVF